MDFVTVNTTKYGKVTINIHNIVSFSVSHPKEGMALTRIDTVLQGYPLFVEKDISKELTTAIRANQGSVVVIG